MVVPVEIWCSIYAPEGLKGLWLLQPCGTQDLGCCKIVSLSLDMVFEESPLLSSWIERYSNAAFYEM